MEHFTKKLGITSMKKFKGDITELKNFISEFLYSKDYLESIELAADLKAEYVINNSGAQHATIVMSNILRTAEMYVYIYAGDLKGDVSIGEYLKELKKYLHKPNTILDVILEKKPDRISPAIKEILDARSKRPDDVKIGVLANPDQHKVGKEHFTISDDRMFRKEIDIQNYIAIASFNDPQTVTQLKEQFNLMVAEPLENFE